MSLTGGFVIDGGPALYTVSLVDRRHCDNPDCLIDQSVEGLWAWYNEIKDDPKIDKGFQIQFLERLVGRLMRERKA